MANVFESQKDCPPVENFMWNKVAKVWGDFGGIIEMSLTDLYILHSMCSAQIAMVQAKDEEPKVVCKHG